MRDCPRSTLELRADLTLLQIIGGHHDGHSILRRASFVPDFVLKKISSSQFCKPLEGELSKPTETRPEITSSRHPMTSPVARTRPLCFDTEHRKSLVHEGASTATTAPKFVFCLWVAFREETEEEAPYPLLQGIYVSPYLAEHDAVCWILRNHRDAGCNSLSIAYSPEHESAYEGCFEYFTPPELVKEIQREYSAFSTMERVWNDGPRFLRALP